MQDQSTRTCRRCGELRSIDEFRAYASGRHEHVCRPCYTAAKRQWRQEHPGRNAEILLAWRSRNVEKHRANSRRWAADNAPKVRARALMWQAANIERHRMIQRAASYLRYHIRAGNVQRGTACEDCGRSNVKIQAAHSDYSRPLDVRWLCASCHAIWDHLDPKTLK